MNPAKIEMLELRCLLSAAALLDASGHHFGRWASAPVFSTLGLRASVISAIRIHLQWNAEPTERGGPESTWTIERDQQGAGFVPIATVPSSQGSYTDIGLRSNTNYSYRLRLDSTGAYSSPASATTKKYDSGLLSPFQHPSPVTGQTRSILSFGATPNNSSNDDGSAIRNAINASQTGDEVYIPNGVYHIMSRDIRLKSGVSIRGESMSGAILSAVFTDAGTDNPNSQMFRAQPGVRKLTISNLRIEMSGGQSMQYGLYLGGGSVGVQNVSRIAVENVNIEDFEKFAIAIRNGDNILVTDSLIRNATALGGGGQGYGVMIGYPNSRNNWINHNTIGPVIRHAVVIQYEAHHNLIENNTAIDNTLDAYDLHGEDEYSNEIRYNVAYGSGGFGIGIGNTGSTHDDSGPFNWIHHNEVHGSRGGINIILGSDQQYIEDNNFHDNSNEGILVSNGGGSDLWFLRNNVKFNSTGARIEDAPNLLTIDNTITNNTGRGLIVGSTTINYMIFRNDFRNNGLPIQLDSLAGIFEENLI